MKRTADTAELDSRTEDTFAEVMDMDMRDKHWRAHLDSVDIDSADEVPIPEPMARAAAAERWEARLHLLDPDFIFGITAEDEIAGLNPKSDSVSSPSTLADDEEADDDSEAETSSPDTTAETSLIGTM